MCEVDEWKTPNISKKGLTRYLRSAIILELEFDPPKTVGKTIIVFTINVFYDHRFLNIQPR